MASHPVSSGSVARTALRPPQWLALHGNAERLVSLEGLEKSSPKNGERG